MTFDIEVSSLQPPRFRLIGDLDLAAVALCEEVLDPACEHRTAVELDLGEVQFVDSSGLRTLVRLHRICDAAGGDLRLRNVPAHAAHVITVTGLDQLFSIDPREP